MQATPLALTGLSADTAAEMRARSAETLSDDGLLPGHTGGFVPRGRGDDGGGDADGRGVPSRGGSSGRGEEAGSADKTSGCGGGGGRARSLAIAAAAASATAAAASAFSSVPALS